MSCTIRSASFREPEAFASSVHNCHARITQIGKAGFQARITLLRLADLHLCLAQEAAPRRAVIAFPPDRAFLRMVAQDDPPKYRNGVTDQPGSLTLGPGLSETTDETTGPARSRSLSIPLPVLLARIETLFADGPRIRLDAATPLRLPAAAAARMIRLHEGMIHQVLVESADTSTPPDRSEAMRRALWDALDETLAAATPDHGRARAGRGLMAMHRAAEYISAHQDRPISLAELCAATGCSIKTLETTFVACFGETPHRYLRRWRMWRARDLLRAADPAITRVSGVAVRCGFWELGRFAVAYRRMFGETPSQTLKGRADRPEWREFAKSA